MSTSRQTAAFLRMYRLQVFRTNLEARLSILLKCLAVVLAWMSLGLDVRADDAFPKRPLKIIVPYTAGGTTDLLARRIGEDMATRLGQPVIVENRPGGGTAIAAEYVGRQEPDGYTMLVASNATLAINDHLGRSLAFSSPSSFDYVSLLATVPNVIVVRRESPLTSLEDLVSKSKAAGRGLSVGSMGAGTSTHIGIEVIKNQTGANLLHIPYKGSAPALTDLMGGSVDAVVDTLVATRPQIQAGTLRPLAVFGPKRSTRAPDIPSTKEGGAGDLELDSWFGLVVPKGTPAPVIAILHQSAVAALNRPAIRSALEGVGVEIVGSTPAAFHQFAIEQHALYGKLIKDYHLDLN